MNAIRHSQMSLVFTAAEGMLTHRHQAEHDSQTEPVTRLSSIMISEMNSIQVIKHRSSQSWQQLKLP